MRKLLILTLLLLLVSVPVFAQEGESAFVRAAHFSPDAPVVDVFVNGERTLEGLDFADLSDWMEVPAGSYAVDVVAEGGSASDSLLSGEFDLSAGDWATLTVIGEVDADSLAFQPIVESLGSIPDGLTRIGLFHAVTSFGPVTVSDDTGRDLVVGLAFPGTLEGGDGYTAENNVAGTYTLTITSEDGKTVGEVGPTLLGAGRYYFYAAIGTGENPTFVFDVTDAAGIMGGEEATALTEADTGTGELTARVAHLVGDAPEVDIYLNGELAVEALAYTEVTEFVPLNGGIYEVAVVPAGGSVDEALATDEIALFEDSVTFIAAIGLVDDGSLNVTAVQETGGAAGVGEARVGFFQSIPTDALFNLTMDDTALVQGVTYPDVFEGAGDGYVSVDIVAEEHSFGIEAPDAAIELDAGTLTMGAGRFYLFIAVGTESAPNYVLIAGDIPE